MVEVVLFIHYSNDEGMVPVEIATDIAGDFGRMKDKYDEVDSLLGELHNMDALSFDGITEYQLSLQVENSDADFDIANESCFYPKE